MATSSRVVRLRPELRSVGGFDWGDEEEPPNSIFNVDEDGFLDESQIHCVFRNKRDALERAKKGFPPGYFDRENKWIYKGMSAVEVFSMSLYNPTDRTLKVFGKVEHSYQQRSRLIYNRKESEGQILLPKRWISLLLSGPEKVESSDGLDMSACLCDAYRKEVINTGWAKDEWTRKPLLKRVGHHNYQRYGCFRKVEDEIALYVCFTVYHSAIGAKVVVKLTSNSGFVYGSITATSSECPEYMSTLFYKKMENKLIMNRGDIPLLKSVVAVPFPGEITIHVNLPMIATGRATFSNEKKSECEPIRVGDVEVSVIWMAP